jgi:hypothetical protein
MVERFERLSLNYYIAADMIVNQIDLERNPRTNLFKIEFLDVVRQQKAWHWFGDITQMKLQLFTAHIEKCQQIKLLC